VGRRWFGDPADEAVLGATLARLVEDVSRLLDRLEAGPVAPGAARVDPEAAAVVLPLRQVPGASLVVQVAAWSSSVGCWWSTAGDPTTAPAAEELFVELPLHPDGSGRAVAWLERELRRPVTDREHGYGVARRRVWSVILDDGRELAVRSRWLPGWTAPGSQLPVAAAAERGPVPGSGAAVATGAAWGPVPGAGLLVGAVGAAAASWVLAAAAPTLFWVSWAGGAVGVLSLAAFALLLAWFRVAGSGRPARVRVPMLAGLALATLGQAAQLLAGATTSWSAWDGCWRRPGTAPTSRSPSAALDPGPASGPAEPPPAHRPVVRSTHRSRVSSAPGAGPPALLRSPARWADRAPAARPAGAPPRARRRASPVRRSRR
jgi:hypothetical protein